MGGNMGGPGSMGPHFDAKTTPGWNMMTTDERKAHQDGVDPDSLTHPAGDTEHDPVGPAAREKPAAFACHRHRVARSVPRCIR